jgi:hypothetical protein
LVDRLQQQNSSLIERIPRSLLRGCSLLSELSSNLNNTERKEGKLHGVFETSFEWKECRAEKFIQQKLSYIYWNPCKGNKLAGLSEQYIHISAKFHIEGKQGIYPVTSFMESRDIDLTRLRI